MPFKRTRVSCVLLSRRPCTINTLLLPPPPTPSSHVHSLPPSCIPIHSMTRLSIDKELPLSIWGIRGGGGGGGSVGVCSLASDFSEWTGRQGRPAGLRRANVLDRCKIQVALRFIFNLLIGYWRLWFAMASSKMWDSLHIGEVGSYWRRDRRYSRH